jgi:WD40 repeat protein
VTTLTGPSRIIDCVAVSRDGLCVAAGDRDQKVHVWTLAGGHSRVFDGHSDVVIAVAFTNNGKAVVSVDRRGQVWTWDLTAQEG